MHHACRSYWQVAAVEIMLIAHTGINRLQVAAVEFMLIAVL
jgi:hypothetical protein